MNKEELKAAVLEIAEDAGVELEIEGLTKAQLGAVLTDLKNNGAPKTGFIVCEGCSVITRNGVVGEGITVDAKDFKGGAKALEGLLNKSVIKR